MLRRIWRESRRQKKTIWALLLGLVLALVSIPIFLNIREHFSNISAEGQSPVYEEIFSTAGDVTAGIRKIDYAIYESLYICGTPEQDVSFLSVEPRHQKGHFWDFTKILIRCPDISSLLRLKNIMSGKLRALNDGILVESEWSAKHQGHFRIFSKGLYTHKIFLRMDGVRAFSNDMLPKVAIIIDDLGYSKKNDLSFIQLDLPFTFSVLPFAPFAGYVLSEVRNLKKEAILHLPLEPKGYPSVDPGPGALLLSMDENEIRKTLSEDLKEIQDARGVNNHMGSSFTENGDKMLIVLEELKKRGLFFIDSRTSSETVGLKLAREIGLPAARRSVFLDNNLTPKAIEIQLERLLNMSKRSGEAIGIAHPHKETLLVLAKCRSLLESEFQLVPVSQMVY